MLHLEILYEYYLSTIEWMYLILIDLIMYYLCFFNLFILDIHHEDVRYLPYQVQNSMYLFLTVN